MNEKYNNYALRLNPLIVIIYAIFCYFISELAQYGGVSLRLPIIIITGSLLLIWCLLAILNKIPKFTNDVIRKFARPWFYIAVLLMASITGITTYNVYQSSINYQGKLSWVIDDFINTRKVKFVNNNIYEHGINGVLQSIDDKVHLPEDLYISNEFSLSFKEDGTITSIYSFIYGETDECKTETFLISYDANKDDRIIVTLGGYDRPANIVEEMRLDPLIDALETLPLREITFDWYDEDVFDIYYIGERDWGYNTEGIIYFNDKEVLGEPEMVYTRIEGYTVSVYLKDQPSITPKRYVYTNANSLFEAMGSPSDVTSSEERPLEVAEEFQVDVNIGYQLVILDAALGSRFYGLTKQIEPDGPFTLINENPFNNETGVAAGLTFIDEDLGFATLSHSGGTYADLFRTTDGGMTFEKIELPDVDVAINENEKYNPFVYPEMPFEEGDKLIMHVNQGSSGDYNNNVKALFQSLDNGATWQYLGEI